MQHHYGKFFKGFLVIYLFFLVQHMRGFDFSSWSVIIGFGAGIMLALIAHTGRNYGTIIFLLIHMTIEWSEYARHKSYTGKEIAFYGFHTILDFIFLWQEIKIHFWRFRRLLTGIAGIGLGTLFIIVSQSSFRMGGAQTVNNMVEPLVIGGILGCTLAHLFEK